MDFIVQPIFNILTLIYALIPGHNFGVAIVLFTILVRFVLFPMVKKQLMHTKAMRELQPELKAIKQKTKGNKKEESLMVMALYKEREIKPLAFIGLMIVQIVLFLALFSGLNRVVNDPQQIYDFSYGFIQNLDYMQSINTDPTLFDNTLLGEIDLTRAAIDSNTGFYLPAFLMVAGSALVQFFQIRQTMPSGKDQRKLREILADANNGKQPDNTEMNAALGRNMGFFMPILIFVITIGFPAALALYWFVGGLVAFMQQLYLLRQDKYAMVAAADATVVSKKPLRENRGSSRTKKTTATKSPETTKTTKTTKTKSGVTVTTYTKTSAAKAARAKTRSTASRNRTKQNRKKRRR